MITEAGGPDANTRPSAKAYTRSQKIQNLCRDPRITVMAEDGEGYFDLRGVQVAGAELVGLMPAGAAAAAAGSALRIDGFDASHLLELRLLEMASAI